MIVLAVAALGFNFLTSTLKLHFKKQPVALAKPLKTIPEQMGHWVQVSKDQPLGHDVEDALAATEYVFRDFVNEDAVPKAELAPVLDQSRSADDRRKALAAIQVKYPTAVINMAVTYYTGLVDTVAHIPDRCYIANGFVPSEYETPKWVIGTNPDGSKKELEVRFINFEDQLSQHESATRSVAYFFMCNGHPESDPLGVRRSLQNLFEKHGYYAKIELMTMVKDRAASAETMADFLTYAKPEIDNCLPNWDAVKASEGGKPVAQSQTISDVKPEGSPSNDGKNNLKS